MTELLEVQGLSVRFPRPRGLADFARPKGSSDVVAVDGVSLSLAPGETLGLVGESGCGKTTLGRALVGLVPRSAGEIRLAGKPVASFSGSEGKAFRQKVQMIFQDPTASLNPKMTVRKALAEVLRVHGLCSDQELDREIARLLEEVGLPSELGSRRPRALSGGQCQRVGIARALALNPRIIVADESVSALDVSIQAQILNLFVRLQQDHRLTMLFISHDLAVVRQICQRVAVMYLGRIVEIGTREQIFEAPKHPYTQALLAAKPRMNGPDLRSCELLGGEPPSPLQRPTGCAFHPRCSRVFAPCRSDPAPSLAAQDGSQVACHLYAS